MASVYVAAVCRGIRAGQRRKEATKNCGDVKAVLYQLGPGINLCRLPPAGVSDQTERAGGLFCRFSEFDVMHQAIADQLLVMMVCQLGNLDGGGISEGGRFCERDGK